MRVIAAQGLGKHFGTRTLFSDEQFTLTEGCRVGLIGASDTGYKRFPVSRWRVIDGPSGVTG